MQFWKLERLLNFEIAYFEIAILNKNSNIKHKYFQT